VDWVPVYNLASHSKRALKDFKGLFHCIPSIMPPSDSADGAGKPLLDSGVASGEHKHEHHAKSGFGDHKSIGMFSSICLISNNITGPVCIWWRIRESAQRITPELHRLEGCIRYNCIWRFTHLIYCCKRLIDVVAGYGPDS
jgi:hypothetical protein